MIATMIAGLPDGSLRKVAFGTPIFYMHSMDDEIAPFLTHGDKLVQTLHWLGFKVEPLCECEGGT